MHMRMLVSMDFGKPRRGTVDGDTQLFGKFALERIGFTFGRFDLAAGEFPIAGIRLALGARAE